MATYKLKIEPAKINMGPIGFNTYAVDFLRAYASYEPEQPFSPASNYLVCRSIELSFKSFLSAKGMKVTKIKSKFGHDLVKVMNRAIRDGVNEHIALSDDEVREIVKANEWYCRKGFEYFDIQNIVDGIDKLPNKEILLRLAERMATSLKQFCINAAS